jgi:RNA polymerase-associated protein
MNPNLTLFSGSDDLLSHRVRLALAAKNVTAERIDVDPTAPPEALMAINPYHSVPTLAEREVVLYAACVITEYLDDRYPHPPLMPADPLSRARLRLATLRLEHDWVPHSYAIARGDAQQQAAGRAALTAQLGMALPLFKASKFFLNPEFSLADCMMAPLLWRLQSQGVPLPEGGKAIEDYMFRVFRLPFFARSLTEAEAKLREIPA